MSKGGGSEKGFKSLGWGRWLGLQVTRWVGGVDCPVGVRGRIQNLEDQALDGLGYLRGGEGLCLTGLGWGQGCPHHNVVLEREKD